MPGDLHWLACRWVRRAWRVHPVASNPSPCRWSAMMDLPRPSRSTDGSSQPLSLTWGRTRTRGECPYPSLATEIDHDPPCHPPRQPDAGLHRRLHRVPRFMTGNEERIQVPRYAERRRGTGGDSTYKNLES